MDNTTPPTCPICGAIASALLIVDKDRIGCHACGCTWMKDNPPVNDWHPSSPVMNHPIPEAFSTLDLLANRNRLVNCIAFLICSINAGMDLRSMAEAELTEIAALLTEGNGAAQDMVASAIEYMQQNSHLLTSGKAVLV